jgi:hypothetical protein
MFFRYFRNSNILEMKKIIALGAFVGALFMTSCEPNGPAEEPATYPGDSLTVSNAARPLVIETTGAWCQYCPNGAEIMTILDGVLGDSVVLIANHVGDWFSTDNAASSKFDDNFPTSGVPNFYVNNTDVGQSPAAAAAAATLADVAFGVEVDVMNDGTKLVVYPRVKALETNVDNVYMIQSYLLLNGVIAKDYGNGVDLNQVSSLPKVSTGSGATPTTWAQDAALVNGTPLITSGTKYTHDEVLYRHATAAVIGWTESDDAATADTSMVSLGPWGMNLGDLNPLGNAYAAGDVYGTRYTPMQFHIALPTLPFDADMSVATIVWQLRQDGSGTYDYVNGAVTHVH